MKNPCIKVCEFDADVCRGCDRTRDEIRAWKRLDKPERRSVMALSEMRLLALAAKGRRKSKR
jgi:predicted Fe-S protein YdhL (DUF1289 family)